MPVGAQGAGDGAVVFALGAAEEFEDEHEAGDAEAGAGEHGGRGVVPRGGEEARVDGVPVPEHLWRKEWELVGLGGGVKGGGKRGRYGDLAGGGGRGIRVHSGAIWCYGRGRDGSDRWVLRRLKIRENSQEIVVERLEIRDGETLRRKKYRAWLYMETKSSRYRST